MIAQQNQSVQVSSPKTWDKATPKVNIGNRICAPFTPIMQVIDKDVYPDGQTWLLVKPTSTSFTEEWIVEPEQEEASEFEQGLGHGERDAAERLHPIYIEASCQFSAGYLDGYNNRQSPYRAYLVGDIRRQVAILQSMGRRSRHCHSSNQRRSRASSTEAYRYWAALAGASAARVSRLC